MKLCSLACHSPPAVRPRGLGTPAIEDRRSLEARICLSIKAMGEVRVLIPPTYTTENPITTSTINFGNMSVFHGPRQSERL